MREIEDELRAKPCLPRGAYNAGTLDRKRARLVNMGHGSAGREQIGVGRRELFELPLKCG